MKYLNVDPCPKCKNKTPTVNAIIDKDKTFKTYSEVNYYITCGCGMQSPIFKTKVEAVHWWNGVDDIG